MDICRLFNHLDLILVLMLEVATIVGSPSETEIVYLQDVQACPAVSEWLTGRVIITSNCFCFFFFLRESNNLTHNEGNVEK